MGQRDLTVRWAVGAGKAKLPLIEKGLIADDGGGFFGWGVEHGHLGKTEIFCKFSPSNPESWKAVDAWEHDQNARAVDEKYFAITMVPEEEVERRVGPGSVELPHVVVQGPRHARSQRGHTRQGHQQDPSVKQYRSKRQWPT